MPQRPDTPCAGCGKLLWTGTSSLPPGLRTCRGCRGRRTTRQRHCLHCGKEFYALGGSGATRMCCSHTCDRLRRFGTPEERRARRRERDRPRLRQKCRARRAQMRGGASEPYTTAEIAGRDRFRCGLCGRPVAMAKVAPHPRAPVVDHIIPLSQGGSDLRANVQLAHFVCNARKGAAGGGEQLALIG